MRLVLASASPRRRDLLAAAGITCDIRPQDVDEAELPGELPMAYVLRVARAKAAAGVGGVVGAAGGPVVAVLAADTTVAVDGHILAKAADAAEALAMLRRLAGRAHHVHTAVVLRVGERAFEQVVTTEVHFRALTEAELATYVAGREWHDKAGAYGIQGQGGALVSAVYGSYTNVVGLPLAEVVALLGAAGVGGAA
jgi:septum formation protein